MRITPLVLLLAACGSTHEPQDLEPTADASEPRLVLPDHEPSPSASERLADSELPSDIPAKVDGYFDGFGSRRLHVQLDRPMYRPGEAVWVKSWAVRTRDFVGENQGQITYELIDPRGQVAATKRLGTQASGTATNDFVLDSGAPGGRWTLKATLPSGEFDERPFVVASYAAPRIKKSLDFVREAYGPGERVEALVELTRPDGAPLAEHAVRAMLQVDGRAVFETELTSDDTGAVFVAADLPKDLVSSDGLLTVFVEDGGITESISRSVPIVLADVQLAFFPEGGDLVQGLPGRVYFEATNAHGEPADVKGDIVDDAGTVVAQLESIHDGMGRVAFTPKKGRRYMARIAEPAGVRGSFPLPDALSAGCVLRSFDDVRSEDPDVRLAVRCHEEQEVLVAGMLKERSLDAAPVKAGPDRDTVVFLDTGERASEQGVVTVTVFDAQRNPLAERLVYRNPGRDLRIALTADRNSYGPRDEVVLAVQTTDPSGKPVPAEVALSVVDDAVIGLADDEEGHILSRLYLEPELRDSPEDPAFYFDPEETLASRGLDLVLGTRGHRRFEWVQVWEPPQPMTIATRGAIAFDDVMLEGLLVEEAEMPMGMAGMGMGGGGMALDAVAGGIADAPAMPPMEPVAKPMLAAAEAPRREPVADKRMARARPRRDLAKMEAADELFELGYLGDIVGGRFANHGGGWATVRVFPKPDYSAGFTGVRSDFRDTVHWEPTVNTDANGEAEVRFYLSDATTTFRVTAEGLGAGAAGHGEATLVSTLPVSITTRLPPAVSSGDTVWVPLTVSSSRLASLPVQVQARFDSELVTAERATGELTLPAQGGDTHWVPVRVGEGAGEVGVRLEAEGGGLTDAVEKQLRVVPPGFPRSFSAAGEMAAQREFTVYVDDTVPGSLQAAAVWQPSTVSTLIQGMEGLIQTPGGCFEQTSSTNWPNVAILNYLESHDGDPRLRVKSSQALDAGYKKLSGYQVGAGGFETWGSGPGKEVLSAFGLLQFRDMSQVYPVDAAILTRDADYLLDQRDGKGGFKNSGESAHGYGSAPKPVLDGFITYALTETGHAAAIGKEIEHQADVAASSKDPYVLALAARALQAADHRMAPKARERLAEMQAEDGSFPGAQSSITRSYEANLLVESTALASLALMDEPKYRMQADKAVAWLIDNRRGVGTWGATQATALALDALSTHADNNKRPRTGGVLEVEVNGQSAGTLTYVPDHDGALVIDGWEAMLRPGKNKVVLKQLEGEYLPFTLDVQWKSVTPNSAPGAELSLNTKLAKQELSMGDTVRMTATLGNNTGDVVPSPIARIGLPAGLEAQTWQLDELKDRGVIAFYETRPREVTLYWDGIHAKEVHEVALDLVAAVPGTYTAPASSAYPYYDDDEMAWVPGLEVSIEP
ncbi:MAG: hypothetical protein EP330_19010 [Deltaproteobacteria bacterium]|nr:MAG: hypothetical protein EP330_19010 [Deltaproteobacteria bacterium]